MRKYLYFWMNKYRRLDDFDAAKGYLFEILGLNGSKLDDLKALNLIENLTPANSDLHRNFILGLPLMTENMELPLRKFKNDIFEQLENAKKK